jgi:hypothetical protein
MDTSGVYGITVLLEGDCQYEPYLRGDELVVEHTAP